MNNVTLIGASGFVGTAILNELLTRGHQVTAVARNPEKINVTSPDLKIVKADVAETQRLLLLPVKAWKTRNIILSVSQSDRGYF